MDLNSKFTEDKLEQAIIELLVQQGYPHVLGELISREPNDVLIKDDLKAYLAKLYANDDLALGEIDSVCRHLEVFSSSIPIK